MINEHFGTLQNCIDPEQKVEIRLPAGAAPIFCQFKNMSIIGMVPLHALMQARDLWGNFHYFDIFDVVSISVQIVEPAKQGS